ncbi:ImpA family type VI secretion system protein [Roseivivax isoporae]|uniref:ImpA N-terminal domain-containing protein n=1 Tax=Roseivivax isoporae LMG 25204 TaxID=1449351 RepID=X7FBQ6_9RHOB|nr:type VI secretion system ImpA family N-terminal domain-containing protein [Roseivivax isoporae]ETX30240.1 hypothetical protein RISW2_15510 [Roseivivax isoporae LMG 25204]
MDIDSFLAPLDGDSPSGVELRNDPRFHGIERLLEPARRAERLNPDGTINESAPSVDWAQIRDEAVALCGEGRDLRVLVVVVRALHADDGFAGLARGLALLTRTLEAHWYSLHPALRDRPDPKAAVLPRSNALRQLENDDNGLLGDLRFRYVLTPRGIGPISGDDLAAGRLSDFEMLNRAASGLGQAEKDALVAAHGRRVTRVTAACRALFAEEPERAGAMVADLRAAEAGIAALCKAFDAAAGLDAGTGLVLPELSDFLAACRLSLEAGQGAGAPPRPVPATNGAAAPSPSAAPAPVMAAPALNGAHGAAAAPAGITSRADVEACLDRIVDFYERTEPSSPIPHLARRMRRMVSMDFLELMEEIAPSGLKEFRNIAGVEETKKR